MLFKFIKLLNSFGNLTPYLLGFSTGLLKKLNVYKVIIAYSKKYANKHKGFLIPLPHKLILGHRIKMPSLLPVAITQTGIKIITA